MIVDAPFPTLPLKRLITSIASGVSVNATDVPAEKGQVGVLKTSCVYSGRFDPTENKTVVPEEYDRVACPVKAGTLVVSRMNTPDLVGAAGLATADEADIYLPDRLWQVTFDGLAADPRFVYWWTRSTLYRDQVKVACAGTSSSMQNLDQGSFRSFAVPRLLLDEQTRIANFLDEQTARIDALIAEKEQLAAALKDIEEVTAFDFVTRGLARSAESVQFTEEWLRDVPAHWALRKLRHFATVGNGSTPKRDNEEYWSGGEIPWLNSGSVNASRITEASDYVTETARKACHLPMVRAGSTVVALTGQGKTRGSASIVDIATTINQHLAYVSVSDGQVADDYLWVLLTGFYSVLRYLSDGEGSTKGALTCEQLKRLRVPIPPPHEQAAIVAAYRERTEIIEALRSHASEHIDLLREYRSSLITAAVTAQLDITIREAKAA